jgi:signal transduction histidine kinase
MWVLSAFSTLSSTTLTGFLWVRGQRESVNEQLQASGVALLSLGVSDFSELKDFEQFDQFIEDTLQMEKVNKIIRIYDRSHKLVFSTVGSDFNEIHSIPTTLIEKPTFFTIYGNQDRYQSLVIPYEVKKKKGPFYLQIVIPLPRYSEILKNLWWESLVLMSFLMILSLTLSRYLSRRLLKPVQDIANHLEGMDPNQIENWEPLQMDEKGQYLGAIGSGINTLIEKTRAAVSQIRKISRYVAHEMRTPLTILQGEAENALSKTESTPEDYKKVLRSSLEEIQRMSEIVTTVLQVGKMENVAIHYQPLSFDLKVWLENNKRHWEELLGRPIYFEFQDQEDFGVHGDSKLLYRLVDNLIRNIRDHTASNSQCNLTLEKKSGRACLGVEDNGLGIPTNMIESLNQFERYSEAAGVGLNLCFAIAEMCGIKLHFSRKDPQGLRVEIFFPLP